MILIRLMNEMPLWLTVIIVVAVAELYSVGLMLLCRLTWGRDRLSLNNEVAGFKFSVIGVLYAVLLGFVVIAVWEDYRNTETAVRNEAKSPISRKSPTPSRNRAAVASARLSLTMRKKCGAPNGRPWREEFRARRQPMPLHI
jgi:hypothetical protein